MSERVCEGCGGELPTTHPNRRYCSDNCRKRRWDRQVYRRACVECGADIDAHRTYCQTCWVAEINAQHAALLDRVEQLWKAGLPLREIAAALGRGSTGSHGVGPEIHELRKAGRIGYRYKGCESRNVAI